MSRARVAVPRTRLLGLVAVGVLGGIAAIIVMSVRGVPFQHRHALVVDVPAGAPPLQVGDQVRIGGQRAGIVRDVEVRPDRGRVTLDLLPDAWPLGRDTKARVRVKLGSGLTYVQLTPAGPSELPEGARVPLARSSAAPTLPQAAEAFDAATRDALARDVTVGGAALAGQGEDMNIAIGRLRAVVVDGTPILDALTPRPGALSRVVDGTARTSAALAADPAALTGALRDGAAVAGTLDQSRDALGEALEAAPGAERTLLAVAPPADALLDRTARLVRDLRPALRDVRAAVPATRAFLDGGATAREAVDRLAGPAADLLDATDPALRALAGSIKLLPPLSASLASTGALLTPYKSDMLAGVRGLQAVTSKPYPNGTTAPGNPALRFAPVLSCAGGRDPLPDPGEAMGDKSKVGAC